MKRIKVKAEICAGCRQCEMVCSFQHTGKFSPSFSRIMVYKDDRNGLDYPVMCQQCDDCPPIEICPNGAISKLSEGLTWIDYLMCIGCGLCEDVCRYNAIKMAEEKAIICDTCSGDPECVKHCPTGALKFIEAPESNETPEIVFKKLRELWGLE